MKNKTIKIFADNESLADNFVQLLKKNVDATPEGMFFYIALSGGSTPKLIFKYISEHYPGKINWEKIKIFWGDERCVPPGDNESNFKMTNESLLNNISIPKENIFRIHGEADPNEEAERYSNLMKENVPCKNDVPVFDMILLGLGKDGHTVSIFPNQLALFYSDNLCLTTKHPLTNQNRITITGKVINNAKRVVFLVTGENKAQIVAEIIGAKKNGKIFPATLVSPSAGELTWMMDNDSARLLADEIRSEGKIR